MNEWITWDTLGTFAGAAAAITALTQVVKRFTPKVDPKWIALGLSALITLANALYQDVGLSAPSIIMMALNALLMTGASIGLYESALKPVARMISGRSGDGAKPL